MHIIKCQYNNLIGSSHDLRQMEDYQFCQIPFGLTNGVAVFPRAMDRMVEEEALKDTFAYLDNITVAGRHQQEHDVNVISRNMMLM